MTNFQSRLLGEKLSLDEKLDKLTNFINSEEFESIAPVQMSLLYIQAQAMATYSICLKHRIEWLGKEEVQSPIQQTENQDT